MAQFSVNAQRFDPYKSAQKKPPIHSTYTPASAKIQTKLTVNETGDIYEQEADRVADQVTHTSESGLQLERLLSVSDHAGDAGSMGAPPIVQEVLHSPGQSLDRSTREFIEPRFGHDFSRVRVHTDAQAAASAEAVQARAYTHGWDVVFGAGQFAPNTAAGQKLLAHELTHTLEQTDAASTIQRSEGEQPVVAGKEITAEQLVSALSGATVQDRLTAVIQLFKTGDFMTPKTLITLAGLPETAPADERADKAAIRSVLDKIVKVERTEAGFKIVLNQAEVVQTVPIFEGGTQKQQYTFKIKDGATALIDLSKPESLGVNVQDIQIKVVVFVGLPTVSISQDKLTIFGIISFPLVTEKK